MDHRCRLGSLGDYSTPSGSCGIIGRWAEVIVMPSGHILLFQLYIVPYSSLLTFLFCFFVLFHSCCSHARVF